MKKRQTRKGLSAWLVTWEWCGKHAKREDKVAEIMDPRISPERMRQIVELLYHRNALLSEKAAWRLRNQSQPYPAMFMRLEGVDWTGEIRCGHNPWLQARLVDDLVIETDVFGKETATWRERYDPREIAERIRSVRNRT